MKVVTCDCLSDGHDLVELAGMNAQAVRPLLQSRDVEMAKEAGWVMNAVLQNDEFTQGLLQQIRVHHLERTSSDNPLACIPIGVAPRGAKGVDFNPETPEASDLWLQGLAL
jgi:hypothetical protein